MWLLGLGVCWAGCASRKIEHPSAHPILPHCLTHTHTHTSVSFSLPTRLPSSTEKPELWGIGLILLGRDSHQKAKVPDSARVSLTGGFSRPHCLYSGAEPCGCSDTLPGSKSAVYRRCFLHGVCFLSDRQLHFPLTPKQPDSESLSVRLTRGGRAQGKKAVLLYCNPSMNDKANT